MDHGHHLSLPDEPGRRRPDGSPSAAWPAPLLGLGFLGVIAVGIALLSIGERSSVAGSADFVETVAWVAWKFVAALSIAMFALLFLQGVRLLRNPTQWGLPAASDRTRPYVVVAAASASMLALVQWKFGEAVPVPVDEMRWRSRAVLYAGLLAAVPWLTIVWLAYDTCRALSRVDAGSTETPSHARALAHQLDRLVDLWRLLLASTGAFATGVVAAIVSAGALRSAAVVAHDQCVARQADPAPTGAATCAEAFPASNVLLYGALFAFLLSVMAAPLGAAWRARALEFVDDCHPLPVDGRPTAEWVEARDRLSTVLHLDQSIVRNPLTALSVFVPLVTSLLAQFVPQLGGE